MMVGPCFFLYSVSFLALAKRKALDRLQLLRRVAVTPDAGPTEHESTALSALLGQHTVEHPDEWGQRKRNGRQPGRQSQRDAGVRLSSEALAATSAR